MPIANGFLAPDGFKDEYRYHLAPGLCAACGLVQLTECVEPTRLFHDAYAFHSSTSQGMQRHFERFAQSVLASVGGLSDPFIVELGCNDGILLHHIAEAGVRHLGVEPSANVARIANQRGVRTVEQFFDAELATAIADEHGQADVILASSTLCHIPDLRSVFDGLRCLLKADGRVHLEDPYIGEIVARTAFDQFYDEHVYYFSLVAMSNLAAAHGLAVVDVQPFDVHGGCLRYTLAHDGACPASPRVAAQGECELAQGLTTPSTYEAFRRRVEGVREALPRVLAGFRDQGKRVIGYGATSKSTTVTNYCGITPDLLAFISDTTPGKQGLYSPGTHIPIKAYADFVAAKPDVALLFAWNHAAEILSRETAFRERGGQWITYVPTVRVFT